MDESNDSTEVTSEESKEAQEDLAAEKKKETKKSKSEKKTSKAPGKDSNESKNVKLDADEGISDDPEPDKTDSSDKIEKSEKPSTKIEHGSLLEITPSPEIEIVTIPTLNSSETEGKSDIKVESEVSTDGETEDKSATFLELDKETQKRMKDLEEAEKLAEAEEPIETGIFAVKTSIGHEKMVANWIAMRARKRKFDVYAILSPPKLRGYLLLEGVKNMEALQDLIKGVQHARSVVDGATSLEEIEHFLTPKPLVSGIEEGDVVEIIAGPFKGEKAKVTQIDEGKEEITVELFEAMVSIPVTIRGDHVRILEKDRS